MVRGGRIWVVISEKGLEFRSEVAVAIVSKFGRFPRLEGPLEVLCECYPPDVRERDLDNLCKALFDSMAHGGMYLKDSQIKDFRMVEEEVVKGGVVVVTVKKRVRPTQAQAQAKGKKTVKVKED